MRQLVVTVLGGVLVLGCSGGGVTPGAAFGGAAQPVPVELTGGPARVEALRPQKPLTSPFASSALGSPVAPAEQRPARAVLLRPQVLVGEGQTDSVREASELVLTADVAHGEGEHELSVELVTPSQAEFTRRAVTVTLQKDQVHTEAFSFPVSGTLIEFAGLTGTWSARFLLDGRELAVTDFELTP